MRRPPKNELHGRLDTAFHGDYDFTTNHRYATKCALSRNQGPLRWPFRYADFCIGETRQAATQTPSRRPKPEDSQIVHVLVRDNNVDQALKALKKKMQREGVFREMKLRRNFEKPSERKARETAEAVRRARKLERKRLEREGF